jgi:hypothetical protein
MQQKNVDSTVYSSDVVAEGCLGDSEEFTVSQLCMGQVGQKRQQFQKRIKTCICGTTFILQAGSNNQRKYCYTCNPFGAKGLPAKVQKTKKQQVRAKAAAAVTVDFQSDWLIKHKNAINCELTPHLQRTAHWCITKDHLILEFPTSKVDSLNLAPELLDVLSKFKGEVQQNSCTDKIYFSFPRYSMIDPKVFIQTLCQAESSRCQCLSQVDNSQINLGESI